MIYQTRIPASVIPRTWFGRLIAALIAGSLAVVGLFFLAFALIAAALMAVIVIARFWWVSRKLRAQRDAGVIEGSYLVEAETTQATRSDAAESTPLPKAPK